MASVPHSTGVGHGEALHCQRLRSAFAGWPPSFVDFRGHVFQVSAVLAVSSIPRFIHVHRQILVNCITVDLGPLCDTVERLCGLHILAHRFATGPGTLHGVTLPRSWFINLLRPRPDLNKNRSYIPHLVNDAIELLRKIDLQREDYDPQAKDNHQFKHNGSRLSPLWASVYISRM